MTQDAKRAAMAMDSAFVAARQAARGKEFGPMVMRDLFEAGVAAGVAAERERCAKEADAAADRVFDEEAIGACRHIAAAIRKEPA